MQLFEGYEIYWDLWVQLAGHLAWPIVALLILMAFRKPVREMLTRADSFEIGGVKVSSQLKALTAEVDQGLMQAEQKLTQTAEETAEAVENAPVEEAPVTVGQKKIEEGWNPVRDAFETALQEIERTKGEDAIPKLARTYLRQRRYLLCSNQMVLEGWISFELRDTIKTLIDIRDNVSDEARVSDTEANIFARNCQKTARSILNAVRYRLRPETPPAVQPAFVEPPAAAN
jgi:hypothetical protein